MCCDLDTLECFYDFIDYTFIVAFTEFILFAGIFPFYIMYTNLNELDEMHTKLVYHIVK